jgi:hypothetical protein
MTNIVLGSEVKLKASVKNHICPVGRENNKTAKIANIINGNELMMDQDLQGCKWWNIEDVELV